MTTCSEIASTAGPTSFSANGHTANTTVTAVAAKTYPSKDLPPLIQRAIARVNDPSILQELTPMNRWALSVLLRRVSAGDGQDIFWVKRENFAALLDTSEATIYRILATLEKLGLIERADQRRTRGGNFAVGELHLSEHLCQLLGLTLADIENPSNIYQKNPPQAVEKNHRLSSMQDGHIVNQGFKQFSSKRQSATEPLGQTTKPQFVNKCPIDLLQLRQQGLSNPQIFLLMRIAKQYEKRLSDVISVTSDALKPLQGNSLFAYVRTLIKQDKDYAWLNGQQQENVEKQTIETQQKNNRAALRHTHANSWMISKTGFHFEISAQGAVTVYRKEGTTLICLGGLAGSPEQEFWDKVANGYVQTLKTPSVMLC